jgi:hypothetical protein
LFNLLRQLRVPNLIGVEIHNEGGHTMLYGTLAQIMQICAPLTRVRQVFGDPFRKEDVACIAAIHHPLRDVNSSACNVRSIIYIPNFIDRPAVNPHPKLQLRILL